MNEIQLTINGVKLILTHQQAFELLLQLAGRMCGEVAPFYQKLWLGDQAKRVAQNLEQSENTRKEEETNDIV